MAHRHPFSTQQIFEAEPDQHWNHMHTEDPYLHLARSSAAENGPIIHSGDNVPVENGPIIHSGDNVPVDRVHYVAHWNPSVRTNGYSSSSQMVNAPLPQPDASDYSRNSMQPSAAGTIHVLPEHHVSHPSSSNFGLDNNYFDLTMGNGRGPYKRKRPEIPTMGERGSTSRYYGAGSSSDMSSSSETWPERPNMDGQHGHWDNMTMVPTYGANQISDGGESSLRNVRSRLALDLETDVFRNHMPANYSHHPISSGHHLDPASSVNHRSQNPSIPFPDWDHINASNAQRRPVVSSNMSHGLNHFLPGSSAVSAEMGGYHDNLTASRHPVVPQSLSGTSAHTRGVRSSFTHRSNPTTRVSLANLQVGHTGPPDDSLQLVAENHPSRHPRPFASARWRHGDWSGRSRLSAERYRSIPEDVVGHDRLTPEVFMIGERSSYYGSRNPFDQHRDMRLDVDDMSYEELLALGERIGSVNTGLSEDQLLMCLKETVYGSRNETDEEGRCAICLEEYQHMDSVGMVKTCSHSYHVGCIKKWLSMKNSCPICKGPAVADDDMEHK